MPTHAWSRDYLKLLDAKDKQKRKTPVSRTQLASVGHSYNDVIDE
eukprot:COSAG05_NODE_14423_length_397_cov_0.771812_1_plen_44_part_10